MMPSAPATEVIDLADSPDAAPARQPSPFVGWAPDPSPGALDADVPLGEPIKTFSAPAFDGIHVPPRTL